MRNKEFGNLEKAKRYVDAYLKVALAFFIIMAVLLVIAGIILCVYSGAVGVGYMISGGIVCGFGIFMSYMIHALLTVFVDGMNDVKESGIVIDEMSETQNAPNSAKTYESCSNYYLFYADKDAYLSAKTMDGQGIKGVRNVLSAMKFQSEDDARRFAEYKRLEIGEKWQIVKKDLIVPICDVAETVLKSNTRNVADEKTQGNKKNKTNIPQKQVFVYNKNENQYFSGINQQFGTFAVMTCDNPNGAVGFDNEYDATSFMKEFKLSEKDGWVVKQIKL